MFFLFIFRDSKICDSYWILEEKKILFLYATPETSGKLKAKKKELNVRQVVHCKASLQPYHNTSDWIVVISNRPSYVHQSGLDNTVRYFFLFVSRTSWTSLEGPAKFDSKEKIKAAVERRFCCSRQTISFGWHTSLVERGRKCTDLEGSYDEGKQNNTRVVVLTTRNPVDTPKGIYLYIHETTSVKKKKNTFIIFLLDRRKPTIFMYINHAEYRNNRFPRNVVTQHEKT